MRLIAVRPATFANAWQARQTGLTTGVRHALLDGDGLACSASYLDRFSAVPAQAPLTMGSALELEVEGIWLARVGSTGGTDCVASSGTECLVASLLTDFANGPMAVRTSEGVAQVIRRAILAGFLAPGSELPERKVASELDVSRTPIREALFTLQGEGLVELVPGRCARVRHISPAEIEQIFALRSVLETFAARCAAQHADKVLLEQAEAALAAQKRLSASASAQEQAQADLAFHEAVSLAAGNQLLVTVMRQVLAVTATYRSAYRYEGARAKEVCAQHGAILRAMQGGNADGAETLMAAHIAQSVKVALEHFGASPTNSGPKRRRRTARSRASGGERSSTLAET